MAKQRGIEPFHPNRGVSFEVFNQRQLTRNRVALAKEEDNDPQGRISAMGLGWILRRGIEERVYLPGSHMECDG